MIKTAFPYRLSQGPPNIGANRVGTRAVRERNAPRGTRGQGSLTSVASSCRAGSSWPCTRPAPASQGTSTSGRAKPSQHQACAFTRRCSENSAQPPSENASNMPIDMSLLDRRRWVTSDAHLRGDGEGEATKEECPMDRGVDTSAETVDLSARSLLALLEECNPDASNDRAAYSPPGSLPPKLQPGSPHHPLLFGCGGLG